MDLSIYIEAILFMTSEPQTIRRLSTLANSSEGETLSALEILQARYAQSGGALTLVRESNTVTLGTVADLHPFVASFTKQEQEKELGAAALETLTLILYQSPISRSMIDRIRGVNSSYILRHLLTRGLIERREDKAGARSYLYGPTVELLAYLGIASVDALPEREKIQTEIARYLEGTAGEITQDEQKSK